jgi:molybdopterin biosynthesis enzyme
MYLTTVSPNEAIGHILRHNISDPDGRKAFHKGHRVQATDLERLLALHVDVLRVAVLEAGDVHEDEAARRLAATVTGYGITASNATHSRVNLLAASDGVVRVDIARLEAINDIDGLTIATVAHNRLARARKRVATIKIIPFAVREEALQAAEDIGCSGAAIIALDQLRAGQVGVLLVGSATARERIERTVYPAIQSRIAELGSAVLAMQYVAADETAIAAALQALQAQGATLLIIAGETSIMDRDDVTPAGIRLAGGRVEHYGAPVEPGNLLLLAYSGTSEQPLPILGAPGCVRSRDLNIVDLLLPRLLAGEYVSRRAIVELGHGGLLG